MGKNKKIWFFAPTMIVSPILDYCLIEAAFVLLWFLSDNKTLPLDVMISFIFMFIVIPFLIMIFMVLWHLQFIIFKDDYFIFGNVLKRELCRVKYEKMIVVKELVLSNYARFCKLSEDEKKKKKQKEKSECFSSKAISAEYVLFIFENIKKFNTSFISNPGSFFSYNYNVLTGTINLHFKKRIIIFYNRRIEDMFVEIQHSRGKFLDGTDMKLRSKPFIGDR